MAISDSDRRIGKWRVHFVDLGDAYGKDDSLICTRENLGRYELPLVEFYDMSQDAKRFPQGQFVSRYYMETSLGLDTRDEGFKDALSEVLSIQDPIDRALEAFCVVARTQYFNDGNKRTAQLVANKILIENGCGVLAVPKASLEEFADRLLKYYETNDSADLKQFLRDNALDNPDLKPSKERFVPNRERFVSKSEPSLRETAEECRSASEMLNKETESHGQNLNVR